MKQIARKPTRVLHLQRTVDGRTHQANALAHWDHVTKDYVAAPELRAAAERAIAAQVAAEPASPARLAWLRAFLEHTHASLAALLGVDAATLAAWERGEGVIDAGAWRSLGALAASVR